MLQGKSYHQNYLLKYNSLHACSNLDNLLEVGLPNCLLKALRKRRRGGHNSLDTE